MPQEKRKRKKLLTIGLDGVPPWLLHHLLKLDLLPNIQQLIKQGSLADLESVLPPLTGPAWISFVTGKTPQVHGCFGFTLPTRRLDQTKTIYSKDILYEPFYETLEKKDVPSVLINLPGSYPPRSNQITVTSLLTRGEEFFFPKTKRAKYQRFLQNYKLVPDQRIPKKSHRILGEIRQIEKNRFELAKALFQQEDWQFFFLLISGTDWIQHSFHHELMQSKGLDQYTQLFSEVDNYISWFNQNKDPNTPILLLSDHGFKDYQGGIHVNTWLKEEGYLKTSGKTYSESAHQRLMMEQREIEQAKTFNFDISRLVKFIAKNETLYKWALKIYKQFGPRLPFRAETLEQPDFSRSKAYYHQGTLGIYINDKRFEHGIVTREEKAQLCREITQKLKTLKDPKTGKKVFEDILQLPQVEGNYPQPDIALVFDNYWPRGDMGPLFLHEIINNHHRLGVIIQPQNWPQARTLDQVASTILDYFQG